jgi:hypothetical protein
MIRALYCLAFLLLCNTASAADWITAPSYYSHDPQTGERVTQYTPIGPVYRIERSDYMQSGYRHTRSSLQMGRSIDHMHIVEEWGRPVRPYGEWRYPYRPYSVPYPEWGAPFAGLNVGGYYGGPWYGGGLGAAGPGGIPYGGIPGGGGAFNGIPPAALTHPAVPNNPGLGFPGQGGVYPYSDEHYPLNRGSWQPSAVPYPHHQHQHLPPSSGVGGT